MRLGGRRARRVDQAENPFWITYSDLLSSLVMVFLVLLMAFQALTMLQVDTAEKAKAMAVEEQKKSQFFKDKVEVLEIQERASALESLLSELEGLQKRFPQLEINKETGEVGIPDQILFPPDLHELSGKGRAFLSKVIPDWAAIITKPAYRELVQHVIFEGRADMSGPNGFNRDQNYLYNLRLTQNRAQSVATFVFGSKVKLQNREVLRTMVTAAGRSNVDFPLILEEVRQERKPQGWTEKEMFEEAAAKSRSVVLRLTFWNPLLKWNDETEAR